MTFTVDELTGTRQIVYAKSTFLHEIIIKFILQVTAGKIPPLSFLFLNTFDPGITLTFHNSCMPKACI